MREIIEIGKKAKAAAYELAHLETSAKDRILRGVATNLVKASASILEENRKDLENAKEMGLKGAIVDRLTLDEDRILGIAGGLEQIAGLEDPVGVVL